MFLISTITVILLFIPGPECSVAGSRSVAARELDSDDDYLNKILQLEYEKILQEKLRREELLQRKLQESALDKTEETNYGVEVPETKDLGTQNNNPGDNNIDLAADATDSTSTTEKSTSRQNYSAPLPPQRHTHTNTVISQDNFVFLVIVTACSVAGLVGLIMAGVCWYKLHKKVKAASDVDYPAYGVTGPTKERLPSPGDRKLAQSAQMYHYQHQKQQMIAMEKANGEMKQDASEDESEEENEEGDYTVYECPGLAPTGQMEVRNPLFTGDAQTPVNGEQQLNISKGQPDEQTE